MEANYKIVSEKPSAFDNVISVYNYHGLNEVFNQVQYEVIPSKNLVGFWKIKKLKNQ